MRFDVGDLRLFLAVADAGSITAGAAAANLSLAAASERLAGMEAAADVALLLRGRRGVSLTMEGETLAHHARLILRQMGAMRAELALRAAGFRGSIRLLANSAAVAELLPSRLGPFLASHPGIDIDLSERPSPDIVKAIAGGFADIGIVSDAADPGALRTRPFATDRLVVVCARDHPLAGGRRIAFDQVAGERMIAFDGPLQRQIDEQARRIGRPLHPRVRVRTFEAVCRLAASNAGIGIVPETAARRFRRAMPLATIHLADRWATRLLLLCFAATPEPSTAARLLLDHLSAAGPKPAAKP